MKVHSTPGFIYIDLSVAEAKALLEELLDVRGGTRMPKIRQVCQALEARFELTAAPPPKKSPKNPPN